MQDTQDAGLQEPVNIVTGKLSEWLEGLIALVPNLAVAVVLVVVGWFVAKIVRRLVRKGLSKSFSNPDLARLAGTTAGTAVFLAIGFVALGVLNLDKTVTTLLAGAGIIGVAIGFAFQDTAANFISGVAMAVRQPFKEGDLVYLGEDLATVERIDLRTTVLRRLDGPIVYIPNKSVFENRIVNYTEAGSRRVELDIGVSYADDLNNAKKIALDAVAALDCRDTNRDPEFFWSEFGGSSINGKVRFWLDDESMPSFLEARSSAVVAVKKAFDDAGITIPFPIRTIDFGIEGGTTLKEALPWDKLGHAVTS